MEMNKIDIAIKELMRKRKLLLKRRQVVNVCNHIDYIESTIGFLKNAKQCINSIVNEKEDK